MNLKEYVNFYKELKSLNELKKEFLKIAKDSKEENNTNNPIKFTSGDNDNNTENQKENELKNLEDFFFKLNNPKINDLKLQYKSLFNLSNFCHFNRWGSYDCTLCRMTFLNESQYNDHEKTNTHKNNLENCANVNELIFKSFSSDIKNLVENFEDFQPIIFLSIFEHNSNALPWRECGAKVVYIENDDSNNFDYSDLEKKLKLFKNSILKIGTFTAASNITGVYLDVDLISLLLHQNNALAFYDYATAAPYVKIDMNNSLPRIYREKLGFKRNFSTEEEKLIYKDSVFFSPHKFVGGPNTPGVLVIKQHVVRNLLIPSEPGGGVVLFVRKEQHK